MYDDMNKATVTQVIELNKGKNVGDNLVGLHGIPIDGIFIAQIGDVLGGYESLVAIRPLSDKMVDVVQYTTELGMLYGIHKMTLPIEAMINIADILSKNKS